MSNNPGRASGNPLLRAWIPALIWLAVIALESTSLGRTENTGSLLLPIIRFFKPSITDAQFATVHHVVRKIGHFVGYATLSLLLLRAWWATLSLPRSASLLPHTWSMLRAWNARSALIAWLSAVAVAGLDEWHQTFLPGRTGSWRDIVLESMAAACVQLLAIAMSDVAVRRAEVASARLEVRSVKT